MKSIKKQYSTFLAYLRSDLKFSPTQRWRFRKFLRPATEAGRGARQMLLAEALRLGLRRKKALASEEESRRYFAEELGNPDLESATVKVFAHYPPAFTGISNSGKVKIYLNPGLKDFDSETILASILEQAFIWAQTKKQGKQKSKVEGYQREIEAKEKVFSLIDFLDLSQEKVDWLEDELRQRRLLLRELGGIK